MLKKIPIIAFLSLCANINAQEQLKHEEKIYVSPDKKIYINKEQPVYFRVSTSPDDHASSYLLPSEKTTKYANPMYFDTEGRNTLRSPSAIDPNTKKVVMPKIDVQFDIYADGKPPVTKMRLNHTGRHDNNGIIYYGKGLKVELTAKDETSGVEASYISVDHNAYLDFQKLQPLFEEEKEYNIAYYSVDHVGNMESPRTEKFHIDHTAPTTSFKIIGASKGKMLSSKASVSLSSRDTLSGVHHIFYTINDGQEKIYADPIPLAVLKDGKSQIHYYAVDNVGNKEESKVIAASTGVVENDGAAFSFYIDKEPPLISIEIGGDQYKGKYIYTSERTLFTIIATDDKSGVAKVTYGLNNPLLQREYSEPFSLKGEGLHSITYASADNVGNMTLPQTQQVYVDKSIPVSKAYFSGTHFNNRDTTFITSHTKIILSAFDTGSGIQNLNYLIDGGSASSYKEPIIVSKEGFHTLSYSAKDNVNNPEAVKNVSFFVDNTAPEIFYNFSVKAIGEKTVRDNKYIIYPSNVMLYIASTDNASGVEKMEYKINGKVTQFTNPLKGFSMGNYEIEIIATDVLKNKSILMVRFAIEE
jgi:hypothetical protein